MSRQVTHRSTLLLSLLASLWLGACGDDGGTAPDLAISGNADMSACAGAPAKGAADSHCGTTFVMVDPAECTATGDGGASEVDGGDSGGSDYGDTMYGTSGYDDDCKYQVSYKVDPICEAQSTYFTVTVKYATNGSPVTGAKTRTETFLDETHPAPNSGPTTAETSPGTYLIGPVVFDKTGKWTVRFHFFESCEDSEASPHGHAAFFVDIQ